MTYTVSARRWRGGWELDIAGEGVTQVRTLDKAVAQVRDYLSTLHDADFSAAEVEVVPDLDGYEAAVVEARERSARAAAEQVAAAQSLREVTAELRGRGLSVTDVAEILGVSRGRVSQLTGSSLVGSR